MTFQQIVRIAAGVIEANAARRHSRTLRRIALIFAATLPLLILEVSHAPAAFALAAACHTGGALAARWLFFAEAEHVVGLYYGRG